MAGEQQRAFVVMPFDEDFDLIYQDLIQPPFEAAGYHVVRADDITNQRNILHDIVVQLHDSDLIVADLTDTNPNVYYELGLAHGLERNVVLLSQHPSDTPFDLRSYRMIEYGTRWDKFADAKKRLTEFARDAADGKIVFGNPVSDYRPRARAAATPPAAVADVTEDSKTEEDEDQPGLLDSGVAIQDGFEKATDLTGSIAKHIEGLGQDAASKTPTLGKLSSEGNIRGARSLLRTMSSGFRARTKELQSLNGQLSEVWSSIRRALDAMISHPAVPLEEKRKMLTMVQALAVNARTGKESVFGLVETMNDLPPLEAMFDKAKRRVMDELLAFAAIIEEIESFAGRLTSVTEETAFVGGRASSVAVQGRMGVENAVVASHAPDIDDDTPV